MNNVNNLKILGVIRNFPIGDIPKNREELLSKAEIIAYLSKYQSQFESLEMENIETTVRNFLSVILELNSNEEIPNLVAAERILKLSPGFIQDYNKIQLIKENVPSFNNTFDTISNVMQLSEMQQSHLR